MLTVEKLSDNHRLIYEAIRDAGVAMTPKEVEEATGLPGSTVRGTVVTMSKKGLLNKLEYGLYEAVPLDQVHMPHTSREYGTGNIPTGESVKAPLAVEGSPGYRVRTFTLDTEDDVNLLPAWAVPILMAASAIIVQSEDVERAKKATEKGRKYRLRLLFEDEESVDPQTTKPEPPQ